MTLDDMTGMNFDRSSRPSLRRASTTFLAIGAFALLGACGDDSTKTETSSDGQVSFAGQWARTSPAMAEFGATYVTITSPTDDRLVSVYVDASVAGSVEMHETVMAGSDTTMAMGSDTTMATGDGEMTMREVDFIELPAGVAVALEPGGFHIMLIDLVAPLEAGTTLQLTLKFENAGEIVLDVPVLDEAP